MSNELPKFIKDIEEEIDRILGMSDKEVADEIAAKGLSPLIFFAILTTPNITVETKQIHSGTKTVQ